MPAAAMTVSPARDAQQLEREGDLVEDDRRQRNHQQEKGNREREQAQMLAPPDEQGDACDHADERDAREKQLRTELSGNQQEEARDNEHDARRARPRRRQPQRGAPFPRKERSERNDEEAMRVVVVARPLPGQRYHDPAVDPGERSRQGEHSTRRTCRAASA